MLPLDVCKAIPSRCSRLVTKYQCGLREGHSVYSRVKVTVSTEVWAPCTKILINQRLDFDPALIERTVI